VGQDPSAIREEIDQTRAQMGDTVEAIGYKTDVKSRARDKVTGVRERITGATPSTGDVKEGAQKAVSVAESNPLGLGIAALAGGFLIGMLIPSTKVENEKLGPKADELKEQAKDAASEAVDRGKQVAQEAASAAADTAKEQGQQHAEEMKSSVKS
jgi:ElaB/YqjD/DUF883 family membrane-anchored ribosome-binding protein